jgi:hypothetical protein
MVAVASNAPPTMSVNQCMAITSRAAAIVLHATIARHIAHQRFQSRLTSKAPPSPTINSAV